MQQIFNFFIKNVNFLLFLLLFSVALALTIQSHSYHRSKFFSSANGISGGIYSIKHSISNYFDLKSKNQILQEENKFLREQLYNSNITIDSNYTATYDNKRYDVISANIYRNSYRLANNHLLINKGKNDSAKQDFGVISSKGIIGIVDDTSGNYATVLSILSKKSSINAQLKSSNHFGSLSWDGNSPNTMQLLDVSKFATIKIGDTIITGGQSAIFPKGIDIGTITDFQSDGNVDTYTINVGLFNDMTNLDTVYIINHKDKLEIDALENNTDE